jgi:succinoglycan biosynthesis protein ExoM
LDSAFCATPATRPAGRELSGAERSGPAGQRTCSVCVATYRRPELLEKLLASLSDQDVPEDVSLEIIVVDNDPGGGAKAVCDRFAGRWPLRYFIQPVKNISLTRNVAVEHATGTFLLFIDDDEIAHPGWIAALLGAVESFSADGAFGRVIPEFHEKAPGWIRTSTIFNRPCGETGVEAALPRTGNAIVRASLLKAMHGPFDPAYGVTGGEDTRLFEALKRNGAKFVNCREAVVSEFIPPNRATMSWMLLRAYRGGNTYARLAIETSGDKKPWKRLVILTRAACLFLLSFMAVLVFLPSRTARAHWATRLVSSIGKSVAVFGCFYEEYR